MTIQMLVRPIVYDGQPTKVLDLGEPGPSIQWSRAIDCEDTLISLIALRTKRARSAETNGLVEQRWEAAMAAFGRTKKEKQ